MKKLNKFLSLGLMVLFSLSILVGCNTSKKEEAKAPEEKNIHRNSSTRWTSSY